MFRRRWANAMAVSDTRLMAPAEDAHLDACQDVWARRRVTYRADDDIDRRLVEFVGEEAGGDVRDRCGRLGQHCVHLGIASWLHQIDERGCECPEPVDLAVSLSLIAAPDERDEYGRSTVRLGRNESQGRETR